MPLPAFPLINGNRYDYTSIEILILGVPYRGVKAIDYSDKLGAKKSYGTSAQAVGRTRGVMDASGSIEVFKEDAVIIRAALAALGLGGYGEVDFLINVAFAEGIVGTITDQLVGCRILEVADSHSQGGDALTEKWSLDIMNVIRAGSQILSIPQLAK